MKYVTEQCFMEEKQIKHYSPELGYGFITGANREKIPVLRIPEANGGFLHKWWYAQKETTRIEIGEHGCTWKASEEVGKSEIKGYFIPLCYRQDVPEAGNYRLTLTLWAEKDMEEVLLFAGRRRLVWRGAVSADQSLMVTAVCDVSPIIPRGQTEPLMDLSICLSIIGGEETLFLQSVRIEKTEAHRVYIMGDSTVADQTADFPYAPGVCYSGWGQMLGAFLPLDYCVSNHAHSGLTTESFRSEGHWNVMEPLIRPGDYCLLQFGHNDQKLDYLKADEGYTMRLERYVRELWEKGAKPVLVTPLARNSWYNPENYHDLLFDYAEAVLELGNRRNVPVLDLHGYSMAWIRKLGIEDAKQWFFPSDYTHTNDFGAYKMAAFVSEGLCRIMNTEPIKQGEWIPHGPFMSPAPQAGCRMAATKQNTDALERFASERPDQFITRVECLELVIQRMRFFPINVYNDLFEDVIGHEPFAGTVQCAAQNHMIPPFFICDGKLDPGRAVTLQDFLAVLMPAYGSRKKLRKAESVPDSIEEGAKDAIRLAMGEGLVRWDSPWNRLLTRKEAVDLCRAVQI